MFFQYREFNYKLAFIGGIICVTATLLDATNKADNSVILPMVIVGAIILFFSRKRGKRDVDENENSKIN